MSSERSGLAALPQMDALVADADDLVRRYGREPTLRALRSAVEQARRALRDGRGQSVSRDDLVAAAAEALAARRAGPPRAVINASGVVVHTNLGRAPLSAAAREAMLGAAGYCDLEYDLASGARGARGARLEPLLVDAAGAEAGLAVNNAAAALVLALAAIAGGRDVLVSRGELVEIGGSFRLPDIMAASGARLVEVGTTNRTRAEDYARAGEPAAILKVHRSNFEMSGFTEDASVAELAEVARSRGVPLLHDVGSGLLADSREPWLAGEPSLAGSLAQGADLAICSADKLLGGPQAGLLVGRGDLVAACRRHPLARALRLDKLRIAALMATLDAHVRGAADEVPTWSLLRADPSVLAARARALAEAVSGTVSAGVSLVGGGAAPEGRLPTSVVRIRCADPSAVAARLRQEAPPIVARIEDNALVLDLRTVFSDDDDLLAARLRDALR